MAGLQLIHRVEVSCIESLIFQSISLNSSTSPLNNQHKTLNKHAILTLTNKVPTGNRVDCSDFFQKNVF